MGQSNAEALMSKRINVVLPQQTLQVLDQVAGKGKRSEFISHAVLHYIRTRGRRRLRERLKAGYQAQAAENLEIALQWFRLEEQAWRKSRATSKRRR
jgi:metal-responsive CopG/Arc/MetJ family transcriptional regulator